MISSIAAPICLGSLAALAAHYRRGHQLLAWALGRRQSSWVILVVLAGLVAVDRTPLLLVDATLAAWVVACSLREDHWLAPLLRWRPVAHIGRVSYGMYLLHVPVIGAVKFVFPAETAVVPRFLTSFALTVLAATLCFWFVEAPLLRFKDRLRG
jgi:peptidoglycan/LPS O-acetylase OafA/YrhL